MPAISPRSTRPLAALLGLAALSSGCAMELPDARLIIDRRVLAIRTEVTGTLIPDEGETPKAQALPFETVTVTPFVVDPNGPVDPEDIDAVWLACQLGPGQGLFSCLQDAMPVALDELSECETPSFEDLGDIENLPEPASPCIIDRAPIPEYGVPLAANTLIGGSIELTMIAGSEDGTTTERCANELLSGEFELPNDCLFALQRLDVGPIEQLALLAEMFGVELPGFEAPDPEDIPEPDRHPRISEIRVGQVEDGEQVGEVEVVSSGARVQAPLGATLQIEVDSPEEDLQTFLIPVNNGASFDERDEAYSGDWFRTWGTFLAGTSDDPQSFNRWTLEPGSQDETERPVDDLARLFYVVRDGRQGVNWFWLEVEVEDPAEDP